MCRANIKSGRHGRIERLHLETECVGIDAELAAIGLF